MRFDTRTKKPALWNILIQVIFVLAIVVLLVQRDARRYSALSCVLLAVFVLTAAVLTIRERIHTGGKRI